jgi:hypothetical protein
LDPEGIHSDDTLWEALDTVNMKDTIKYLSGQLGKIFMCDLFYEAFVFTLPHCFKLFTRLRLAHNPTTQWELALNLKLLSVSAIPADRTM